LWKKTNKKKIQNQNKFKNNPLTIFVIITCVVIFVCFLFLLFDSPPQNYPTMSDYVENHSKTHVNFIPQSNLYFDFYVSANDYDRIQNGSYTPLDGTRIILKDSMTEKLFEEFTPTGNAVVIFPVFTAAAYQDSGFYSYYGGNCDESCIVDISFENPKFDYSSSGSAAQILYSLGYDFLTDVEVDENPKLLKNYETVILLHNEYVTKNQFNAISSHPNLIFLYPNALYAEINVNYDNNTIELIRGHNYPEGVLNGFDYEIEEQFHHYEYDHECLEWKFVEIKNGYHLNCYPENAIYRNLDLLKNLTELVNLN
jgi:hypothetical protein